MKVKLFTLGALIFSVSILFTIIFINSAPLFYYDTISYFGNGQKIVSYFEKISRDLFTQVNAGSGENSWSSDDDVVIASRSAVYAVFLTGITEFLGIWIVPLAQYLIILFVVWVIFDISPSRTVTRSSFGLSATHHSRLNILFFVIAIFLASLGSMPFYAMYLMPDIFAPVLILIVAALAIYSQHMQVWQVFAALALGALAVTAHPSHLAVGVLLLCGAAFVALVARPRRAWVGLSMIGAVLLAGYVERTAFTVTVTTVSKAEVINLPFLTMRIIADGPGFDHLQEICPDDSFATCQIFDLAESQNRKVKASEMMFAGNGDFRSFSALDTDTKMQIVREQGKFVRDVVKKRPIAVSLAVLGNTLDQMNRMSVRHTFPVSPIIERVLAAPDHVPPVLRNARLTKYPGWLTSLDAFHRYLYLFSAVVVFILVVWPRGGPPIAARAFAVIVLGGIFANALVCGGISEPADRYGARVIFLLPILAVFLLTQFADSARSKHRLQSPNA